MNASAMVNLGPNCMYKICLTSRFKCSGSSECLKSIRHVCSNIFGSSRLAIVQMSPKRRFHGEASSLDESGDEGDNKRPRLESPFRQWLLGKYGDGSLSGPDIADAVNSVKPYDKKLGVDDLGVLPKNSARTLVRKAGVNPKEHLFYTNIPMRARASRKKQEVGRDPPRVRTGVELRPHPFFLMHERASANKEQWLSATQKGSQILKAPLLRDILGTLGSDKGLLLHAYADGAPFQGNAIQC